MKDRLQRNEHSKQWKEDTEVSVIAMGRAWVQAGGGVSMRNCGDSGTERWFCQTVTDLQKAKKFNSTSTIEQRFLRTGSA